MMSVSYEDCSFDFDLEYLSPSSIKSVDSQESRTEKSKKAIFIAKKKIVATDSLIRRYYDKRDEVEQLDKELQTSKEECKQICLEFKEVSEKYATLENEVKKLHSNNAELYEKYSNSESHNGAMQSHAKQLENLVKENQTAIESLTIENQLLKAAAKDNLKNVSSLEKKKEDLIKDICLLRDIVSGKKKHNSHGKNIILKYEKLHASDDDDDDSVLEDDSDTDIDNHCPLPSFTKIQKLSTESPLNTSSNRVTSKNDNDHDSDCSNEIASADTGRGSSLAFSEADKCFNSPDYFLSNSPINTQIVKEKSNYVDTATSPIIFDQESHNNPSPISTYETIRVILSPIVTDENVDSNGPVKSETRLDMSNNASIQVDASSITCMDEFDKNDDCTESNAVQNIPPEMLINRDHTDPHSSENISNDVSANLAIDEDTNEETLIVIECAELDHSNIFDVNADKETLGECLESSDKYFDENARQTLSERDSPDLNRSNNLYVNTNKESLMEKEYLELNNSNNLNDTNHGDSEIEMILNKMRFERTLLTPIPSTPLTSRSDSALRNKDNTKSKRNSHKNEHVCKDAVKLKEDNKVLHEKYTKLEQDILFIKNILIEQFAARERTPELTINKISKIDANVRCSSTVTNSLSELSIVPSGRQEDLNLANNSIDVTCIRNNISTSNLEQNRDNSMETIDDLSSLHSRKNISSIEKMVMKSHKVQKEVDTDLFGLSNTNNSLNKKPQSSVNQFVLPHPRNNNQVSIDNGIKKITSDCQRTKMALSQPLVEDVTAKDLFKAPKINYKCAVTESSSNFKTITKSKFNGNSSSQIFENMTIGMDPAHLQKSQDRVPMERVEPSLDETSLPTIVISSPTSEMSEDELLQNSNTDEMSTKIRGQNKTNKRQIQCKKLSKLDKLRKKLTPKSKIKRSTISLRKKKILIKTKPLSPPKKIVVESDTAATLNDKTVYDKAVQIMSQLNYEKSTKTKDNASDKVKDIRTTIEEPKISEHSGNINEHDGISPTKRLIDQCKKKLVVSIEKIDENSILLSPPKKQIETRSRRQNVNEDSINREKRVSESNDQETLRSHKSNITDEIQQGSRKRQKRESVENQDIPCKRVLRSTNLSQSTAEDSNYVKNVQHSAAEIIKATDKKSISPVASPLAIKSVINYSDIAMFTDVQNAREEPTVNEISKKPLDPKEIPFCAMLEKYGKKSRKTAKKVPDSIIISMTKKLQDEINRISHLDSNEAKHAMNDLIGIIQGWDFKSFIVTLVAYLKDPQRKVDLYNKINSPPAPPMTKAEQILLYLVSQTECWPEIDIVNCILCNIEYELFKLNRTPEFDEIETMAHFYAVLCRYFKMKSRLRLFMLDAMYCLQFKAVPLIKQCLEVWMHVLPLAHMGIAKSPLVTCLVYLLHFYKCEDRFNRVQEIRNILNRKYFYELSEWNEPKIIEMIKNAIKEVRAIPIELKMLRIALIVIAKRHGPKWCQKNIIKNILIPMLDKDVSEAVKIFCVSMFGPLLKPYPVDMKVHCEIVLNLLLDKLKQQPSPQMEEAIISSLIYMSKHNPPRVLQVLLTWMPQRVSPELTNVLHDFVREKPTKVWKTLLWKVQFE